MKRLFPGALLAIAALALSIPAVRAQNSPLVEVPLVGQSINFYAVLLPPDYNDPASQNKTYPLCVMLHGGGSRDDQYVDLVNDHLKRDGVIYLTPRAPYLTYRESVRQGLPAFSAYPDLPADMPSTLEPSVQEMSRTYTDWIAHCMDDARKRYRITPGKVAVIGHSQGAGFGFLFALDHPQLVKACFLAEGFYSDQLGSDATAAILKKNDIRLTIIHNQDDPVIPFSEGQGVADYLEKNQVPFDHTFFPIGQHNITEPCKDLMAAYVEKWCRGGK